MKISGLAVEALFAKIKAGFNTNLANVAPGYNIQPFTINFPATAYSPCTTSFILGKLPYTEIIKYGVTDLNKMSMFSGHSDNQTDEKPRDFSGLVTVGLHVHIAWRTSSTVQNFEAFGLAVHDAVCECTQPWRQGQTWGPGVTYDGRFICDPSVIEAPEGDGALRQVIPFQYTLRVDV